MAKEKVVNYTAEQVQELQSVYTKAETDETRKEAVAMLSNKFDRSPASVRAKLVNMGIYVKAERTAKDGSPVESKDAIVEEIATLCGVHSEIVDDLAKANKATLKTIRETLQAFGDQLGES